MDLLKLFALLVAVATVSVSAEGPKKKIHIHLPQKVKHIHHHKKIYITNHPAASQYASAFMPSAEGAMSVQTRVALPASSGLVPFNSVEMYDEAPHRMPVVNSAGSKLLPLYHSRGYYGPNPSDLDEQDYDLSPPPEPNDHSYIPPAFSGPAAVSPPLTNYPQKKVKVVKLNEPKKKIRKSKPKRVPVRKPQLDEEIPVSTFHEQFYSDLDGSATLRKVKKPQRVEKIVDGDTEHIHTYSEEHIHKLVYDDGSSKLVGSNPIGSMSALTSSHLYPIKNTVMALSPVALTGLATQGSMGTPSHLEYDAYNPRDVTHDHVFHDHGEIPSDTDISKENLPYPPQVSYTSHGIRIGSPGLKNHKTKYPLQSYPKPTRPTPLNDYSYYENMYQPPSRSPVQRPKNPTHFPTPADSTDDYNPIPSFGLRNKGNTKTRNALSQLTGLYLGSGKQISDYQTQQTSDPAPFAVSSTIVHNYKPKGYTSQTYGTSGLNKLRDPLQNFKDNSYTNNFDSYASASNQYTPENQNGNPSHIYHGKRGKKKSISTQNIRIGGLDHQTTVDHLGDTGLSMSLNDEGPNALDFDQTKGLDSATSTPYTIRESSLAHSYYSAMAAQALQGEPHIGEASNTNLQYVEAPQASTTEFTPVATTSAPPTSNYFEQENTDSAPIEITESTEYIIETIPKHRLKGEKQGLSNTKQRQKQSEYDLTVKDYKSADRPTASSHTLPHRGSTRHSLGQGSDSRKYGDKI